MRCQGWLLACFLLVATVASYDYVAKHQYSLARAGFGFAALSIITFFLEAAVWVPTGWSSGLQMRPRKNSVL